MIHQELVRYAIQRYEYDDQGRQIRTAYYNLNDQPTNIKKKGYHEIQTTYDENGVKTDTFYNTSGNEVKQ